MWFKNIRLYCFTKPFELSPEDLESRLRKKHFQPCSRHDKTRMGWISPIADDLTVKRLKFEDIKEENESFEDESAAQKFDQEFALMTLELSGFFKSFFSAFGGLDDPGKTPVSEPAAKD